MTLSPDSAAQLHIYGELAVAFAGFAGVIGAFSRFRMHAQATAFRIRGMVAVALSLVVASLVPPLIASFGASEAQTWRIAAGFGAVAGSALLAVFVRYAIPLIRAGHLKAGIVLAFSSASVLEFAVLAAIAAGFARRYAAASYLALLFLGILVCAFHFVRVIVAVRLDDQE